MLLKLEGYEVAGAADGRAVLDSALADPPDVILSDMYMPKLSDRELLLALRGDERSAQTRLVFLTGEAQAPVGTSEALQADGLLTKPFSREQLLALLKGCRAGQRSEQFAEGLGCRAQQRSGNQRPDAAGLQCQ